VVLLKVALSGLFSGLGVARTRRAHCVPDGSAAPGGSVPNWVDIAGGAGGFFEGSA
jgi:hypothetical protein